MADGLIAKYGEDAVLSALRTVSDPRDAHALLVAVERERVDGHWLEWLRRIFPNYCTAPFAAHHERFWRYVWSLEAGKPAVPQINVWPRGGAKSTSIELAVTALGARAARRYCLYVSGTQDRADDHVQNIASMLESNEIARLYPTLSQRKIGKFGHSRGWRRNRVRTASGLTIDAIGLDTAARGVKVEEDRPDLIVLDDLDDALDSPGTTDRKVRGLTRGILPAGAEHVAIVGAQNLVHPSSIFAQLVDGTADFLIGREVSGPVPAIEGLVTERRTGDNAGFAIVAGTPTWAGMDLRRCQTLLDEIGLAAFMGECQHDVEVLGGGMFDHVEFVHMARDDVPPLIDVVVACDPAVTNTDQSDSQAVQCDGIDGNGKVYRLHSWEQRSSPLMAIRQALLWAYQEGARAVVVETDQGGDTWESVYREALAGVRAEHPEWADQRPPRFQQEKAGAGHGPKAHRASQMVPDYERQRIVHVLGTHEVLERGLHRFPVTKPLDLVDAAFWSWHTLRHRARRARSTTTAGVRMGAPR